MKSKSPEFETSEQVDRVLVAEKISREELSQIAKQAALTTHDYGNRRFHQWVFQITGNRIERMTSLDGPAESTVTADVTEQFTATEEHAACDGQGCKVCGYTGEVRVTRKPRTSKRPERLQKKV